MGSTKIELRAGPVLPPLLYGVVSMSGFLLHDWLNLGRIRALSLLVPALSAGFVALVFPRIFPYRRLDLSLEDDVLTGPSRRGKKRVAIRRDDIDVERSRRRVFGGRIVWSKSGELAIRIKFPYYSPSGCARLLRALGL